MSVVISSAERTTAFRRMETMLAAMRQKSDAIARLDQALSDEQQSAAAIESGLTPFLTSLGDDVTNFTNLLAIINLQYQYEIPIGQPSDYTSAVIDAISTDVSYNNGTIRIAATKENITSPFVGLLAGDKVSISKAEDATNNGTFTLLHTPQEAGPDVIQTPDFTSHWTVTNWTIAGGFAKHTTADTDDLVQTFANMTGVVNAVAYLLTFTISNYSAGTLTVVFQDGGGTLTVGADGTYHVIVTAATASNLRFQPTSAFRGWINTPVLRPWTGLAFTEALGADNAADTKLVIALEER